MRQVIVGHTAGPWLFDGEGRTFTDRPNGAFHVKDETCSLYVTVQGPRPKESKANARLIAAAPELLETLKQLLAFSEDMLTNSVLQPAREAIAKAEGKV